MYNSILHFIEFGAKEIEKIIKSFIEDPKKDVGDLVMDLNKPIQELQCNIISETLEILDNIYKKDKVRKKNYRIIRTDRNKFMATCGEIKYRRTYFQSKKTGKRVYLTDKFAGIKPHMRISNDVVVKVLENVVDSSYRISGERAINTEDVVSKQAVMKKLHKINIPNIKKNNKQKRKVKILYIDADEDHVSLQFNKEKGDLKKNKNGRKQNTVMPRLIYVHEGIEKSNYSGKRSRLINRHCFGGVYKKSEELWEEVLKYIAENYDEKELKRIYISGDGASWIKQGIEIIGAKSRFLLDKYHLNKYITKAISHLEEEKEDIRQEIYDAISFEDKKGIREIFKKILRKTVNNTKQKTVKKSRTYIYNNWEGIIIKNSEQGANIGCSAEGHISHIYSERMSSRPLGWSKVGVDKMSRLRVYKANGGNIYSLVKYQHEKEVKEIRKEIKEKAEKRIREKRQRSQELWQSTPIPTQIGRTNGLYCELKKLRGVC